MTIEELKTNVIDFASLITTAGAVAVLCIAYIVFVLTWSYSKGDRIGYIQKFSEKGWLCKTWEGELQMLPIAGALPEKFLFTVRDKTIVTKINAAVGKKVALYYTQHKGVPTTCFGETEYFVGEVRILD
ncbi:MAG: hypothetical protein WCK54_02180 [Desulfuromonadales bacterium]